MSKGLFIAFEGTERAGKSTVIRGLKEYLENIHKREVVIFRTPGGTDIGMRLREIIVGEDHLKMSREANAFVFAADWRHSLETVVIPALERGAVVIADRFNLSMMVYQDSLVAEQLFEINNQMLTPTAAYIMTTDYDTMVARREADTTGTNNARDYISREEHERLQGRYNQYAQDLNYPNFYPVNANRDQLAVLNDILEMVEHLIT